jgi:hypothetical protein
MSPVDLDALSEADAVEALEVLRARLARRRQIAEEAAESLAPELAELVAQGQVPAIGVWRKHGVVVTARSIDFLREVASDPARLVPGTVAALSRTCGETIPFRTALARLADCLIERGAEPESVRTAFVQVLRPVAA